MAWKYWAQTRCLEYQTKTTVLINLRSKYTVTEAFTSTNYKPVFFPIGAVPISFSLPFYRILTLGNSEDLRQSQKLHESSAEKVNFDKTPKSFFFSQFYNVKLSPLNFSIEALMDWWKNPREVSLTYPSPLPEKTNMTIASLENPPFLSTFEIHPTHSGWSIFHCRG